MTMAAKLGNDNAWPLPRPRPTELEQVLRQLADRLGDQGEKAMRRAAELSARGYAASTNGSDGGRSSDATSSTERAALKPDMFDGVDYRMAAQMANLMTGATLLQVTMNAVMFHAPDDDEVPAGTGVCAVDGCDHVCNPRKKADDRLRAGFCPRHYKRWCRLGKPDRGLFVRFTETEDVSPAG